VAALVALALLACVSPSGAAARRANPGCFEGGLLGGEAQPAELPGSPEPALLAAFAVLRRPAAAADRPPLLNSLSQELGFQLAGYFPAQLRQVLALADGRRFFTVVGMRRPFPVPPARCLPPELRRLRVQLVQEQSRIAREQALCVVESGSGTRRSGAPPDCLSLGDIEQGRGLLSGIFSLGPTVGLVPDGVATVRVAFGDGTAASAAVTENAYLLSLPSSFVRHAVRLLHAAYRHLEERHTSRAERRRYAAQLDSAIAFTVPSRIEWLSPGGGVVKLIKPPRRGAGLRSRSILVSG
jgi:hypothetical protein